MKTRIGILLAFVSLLLLTRTGRSDGGQEEIIKLAIPSPDKPSGWKLSAESSVSELSISWADTTGQKYQTPIQFHEFPNGTFAAKAEIRNKTNAVHCPPSLIPLADIQAKLPFRGKTELTPTNAGPYTDKYTLIDAAGKPTQVLQVSPVGKDGTDLAFTSGTLYLVFPKGSPNSGILSLCGAPGTRLVLQPGIVANGKKLTRGTLAVDILLKNLPAPTTSAPQQTLFYRVETVGEVEPVITDVPETKNR